ncbi:MULTISPECIES: hypothetical protein [Pseudoalteromonas]|uniref:Uncharacterized protein n=1 Tax=Pseudoalteromonas rubra TaxID=43658 RepID=A0A5S3V1F8_9GAMM|nr:MULTISPECIES: hypothetical protein [Pseudoalteromonas]MCG7562580.1 hypothetical protein [Pseudoalteromonas sp. McH1-42]MEC4089866.1 hypothetical protein [Pseudoalteromonas rubra]QPB84700.1 hypothetical protein CWC22_017620 [Pseudoalteromonas rubra]
MKAALILLIGLVVLSAFSWVSSPLAWFSVPEVILDVSWVGIEMLSLFVAMIAVFALLALLSIGLFGVILVVLIGLVLALLFNSVLIAIPLLFLVAIGWLVSDKQALC